MDIELNVLLHQLLSGEDDTGCSPDLTVVEKGTVEEIRAYLKRNEIS